MPVDTADEKFQRLSWFWFAFPGCARVAYRYEQFLNGIMAPLLEPQGLRARVKPSDLVGEP